ncbi:glycoside hydrolase family 88 protein [Azospirillum sp. ST 5-10]|uniref:glycoside hydrolase family 88 protein n=1 Tax=unclassified Azospirillum TaxID=2630922 RepID=UPI003F49BE29
MDALANPYFARCADSRSPAAHQAALERCVRRLRAAMPVIGLRNPKLGRPDHSWSYCDHGDWVIGFYSGQLWLAAQLSADPAFAAAAKARRPDFRYVLEHREVRDHDLGFQFSLHAVADWMMTGDGDARRMALAAASALLARFREEGGYIQAWNPWGTGNPGRAAFVNGRMIADTMQNLALLHWAYGETGIADFRDVAESHAATTARHLVRPDGTSFHTFVFDPATGEPLRGQTHQGYADGSCWSRGQAWLIHGFAQCHRATGNPAHLDTARRLADTAEALMGASRVPVWDFAVPEDGPRHRDSSAGAVMAAGLYILAAATAGEEAARWRAFADRLLDGLLDECDLTETPSALGLIDHGAAHVRAGQTDGMLPYGDYYFMEALMRSIGHSRFFW